MSFGFKKVQTLSFVLIILASQTAFCSVVELSSALTTLQTKLGELKDIVSKLQEKKDEKKPAELVYPLQLDTKTTEGFNQAFYKVVKTYHKTIGGKLTWCICHEAPLNIRMELLGRQSVALAERYSSSDQPTIIHIEFAESGSLHPFYLYQMLQEKLGYQPIMHFVLIGDSVELSERAENLSSLLFGIDVSAYKSINQAQNKINDLKRDNKAYILSYGLVDPGANSEVKALQDFEKLISLTAAPSDNPVIYSLMAKTINKHMLGKTKTAPTDWKKTTYWNRGELSLKYQDDFVFNAQLKKLESESYFPKLPKFKS